MPPGFRFRVETFFLVFFPFEYLLPGDVLRAIRRF